MIFLSGKARPSTRFKLTRPFKQLYWAFERAVLKRHNVLGYGAMMDGTTNDTPALQNAQAACGNDGKLIIPPGDMLVKSTIDLGLRASWEGQRTERGCNAFGVTSTYSATRILFRPDNPDTPLFHEYELSSPSSLIGPFEFENITFDVGEAAGLAFGDEDLDDDGNPDPPGDSGGQRYVFRVAFRECAFIGAFANRNSVSERITRSGRILLHLTKCFESTVENCSFAGGDIQFRAWACDKPVLRGLRFQLGHLPISLMASGTFMVQYTLDDVQIEGWTTMPIQSNVEVAGSNIRLEQNDGNPTGGGKLTLAETAAVTAGSATVVFSGDMTDILFPLESVLLLTSGNNSAYCYVTAVAGANVTVETNCFEFTWSAAAATAVRIHGIGPLHDGTKSGNCNYVNVSPGTSEDCPAFVYVAGRGTMNMSSCSNNTGLGQPGRSIVIGNKLNGQYYLYSQMTFASCSANIVADPNHPLVHVSNWKGLHGKYAYDANYRGFGGDIDQEVALADRIWIWSPKAGNTAINNAHLRTFETVVGDADTLQTGWAWRLLAGVANYFYDPTLPNVPGKTYRLKIRMKGVAGAGTMAITAFGAGANVSLGAEVPFSASQDTITRVFTTPACWTTAGGRTSATSTAIIINPTVVPQMLVMILEEVTDGFLLTGTATYDPGSVAAGAQTTTTLTVTGAAVGDPVSLGFSNSLQEMLLTGYVSAADTVTAVLRNETAGALDLASGTLRATVFKH